MSAGTAETTEPLRGTLRTVWTNLPLLLAGSVPVAVAWAVLRALPPGLGWLSLAGVGLVVLPALAGLSEACRRLLADEDVGFTELLPLLALSFRSVVGVTVVPAAAAVLTLLGLHVWRVHHELWVLASVGTGLAVTAVTALVAVMAVPYRLRTAAPQRETWLVSAYVTSRSLVPVLGVVSAIGLGVWGTAHLSFALVLLLPAPLALVWATASTTATRRSRDLLAASKSTSA